MISRHQRIVFWSLVGCILAMGALLFGERQHARDRIVALADATPLDAPYSTTESVTLDLANDADGSITATTRPIALPGEVTARARALLEHLIAEYSLPGSTHPLQSGAAVDDVFLLPLPLVGHSANTSALIASTDPNALQPQTPGGELAVINLRSTFVNAHPSGVEVESLTLLSIIGTLHTNLPQIEQIRFLVDGQPRETLAGHADLLRTYPSRDTTVQAQPTTEP
ncbi:GerMN domain-containing protein [Granulicella mallensis]|jgi:hypothetical protein|uniref:GerMN domain-containing protein n=1 Tax=Granulicella mallensis TaxID=940614 RepID=A0A7W7ZQA6_9BACT|nr:GerMN domain-containing protein [Granulicella mallensis]MBB5064118.1 hypothetical protein [Granulicella mallensis]